MLKDIVKKNPKDDKKFTVKTAVADGTEVSLDMAMKMPTRLEAIGEVLGAMLGRLRKSRRRLTGPAGEVAGQIAVLADRKEDAPAKENVPPRLPPLESNLLANGRERNFLSRSYYACRTLQRHIR